MKKGIKSRKIDAAGVFGTHVTINPTEADPTEVAQELRAMSPQARIDALRATPEIAGRVAELQAWHDALFPNGASPTIIKRNSGRMVRFPKTDERALMALMMAIQQAEAQQVCIRAIPIINTGTKVRKGASDGGKSSAKWPAKKQEMQDSVNAIHAERPNISFEEIKRIANKRHGFPPSALKRYTTNPKRN